MTGGDVRIPTGQFAEKIAPTEHLNGLMQDLRLGDALTEREAAAAEAEEKQHQAALSERMAELVKEQEAIAPIDQAIQEIVGQTETQLVAAGTDPSTARDQATLMRGVAVLANRAFPNLDPRDAARQAWEHYGLAIAREGAGFEETNRVLEAFTSDPNFRAGFDEMLELVRAGQFDENKAPTVGELANRLIANRNKSGKTTRKVGAIKVQPEIARSEQAEADEREAAERAQQAAGAEDVPFDVPEQDGVQIREQAGQLAAYLKAAGIDVAGKTNDQVFELVRAEAGRTLFQSVGSGTGKPSASTVATILAGTLRNIDESLSQISVARTPSDSADTRKIIPSLVSTTMGNLLLDDMSKLYSAVRVQVKPFISLVEELAGNAGSAIRVSVKAPERVAEKLTIYRQANPDSEASDIVDLLRARVFPARAGMNRACDVYLLALSSVPRTRGDEPMLGFNPAFVDTCSPHARG